MIQEFVAEWEKHKGKIREKFAAKRPDEYIDIVRAVAEILKGSYSYEYPDPERIHEIDDGHYQGTLVFVIACNGYQPSTYWYVMISYGSCSGCDTLESIRGWEDEITDKEVDGYMTLALHIVQKLKKMGDWEDVV